MKRRPASGPISLLSLLVLALAPIPAAAARAPDGSPYTLEILVDGRPLAEFAARGTTYVEALRGKEYSVRLTNRTGRRVAVALSVDGLNSIDARTTSAGEAAKWILDPHRTVVLDGWQTGEETARRFYFTNEDRSYGAWLGETDNLGIVTAAFFRERVRRPPPVPYESKADPVKRRGAQVPSAADAAGNAAAPSARAETDAPTDDLAATGIGREVEHRVRRIRFDEESYPAAVVSIRYEYRDALVRLGVIATEDDPLARRERARGFRDLGFAPDPYR